jgi:hypothetical protein
MMIVIMAAVGTIGFDDELFFIKKDLNITMVYA